MNRESAAAVNRTDENKETIKFVAGSPLPRGFKNPDVGRPGHRCIDNDGNYRPDWVSIYIEKTNQTASRIPFNRTGPDGLPRPWSIKTGEWVDVPRDVYEQLSGIRYDQVEYDMSKKSSLTGDGAEQIIRSVPRFQINVRLSD